MTTIDLKEHVRQAINDEWPAFEKRHPYLSACLDQELLVISATHSLADDPEYQSAMTHADAVGTIATTAVGIVRSFVADFLRQVVR